MTHKLRTLQGQYRAALRSNLELREQLEVAHKRNKDIERQHLQSVRRAVTVTSNDDAGCFHVLYIRINLDDLMYVKSRTAALQLIAQDIAKKAGWIL